MATTKSPLAPVATVVGGALLAIGSLLAFAKVEGTVLEQPISQNISGLDTPDGKIFLGVGIGILVLGAILFALSGPARRVVAALVVLAGGFMTYAAVIDLTGLEDDIPAEFAGTVSVSAGIGLYLILGGAIIATIGGLLGAFGSAGGAAAPSMPPPPPAAPPPAAQPPQV